MIIQSELRGVLLLWTGYTYISFSYAGSTLCIQKPSAARVIRGLKGLNLKAESAFWSFHPPRVQHVSASETVQLQCPPRSVKEGMLLCFVALLALDEHVWEDTLIFKWLRSPPSLSLSLSACVILCLEWKSSVCIIQCDACSCTLSLKCEWLNFRQLGCLLYHTVKPALRCNAVLWIRTLPRGGFVVSKQD